MDIRQELNEIFLYENVNQVPGPLVQLLGKQKIEKTNKMFQSIIQFGKDPSLLAKHIGIYTDDYDFMYMYCPKTKRVYYSDMDDLQIDKRTSYSVPEFMDRYRRKALSVLK